METQFWDDRYRSREQLFSGSSNGVLVAEATDLPPGHALDMGCGEGADALWLARRGWQVTTVDISRVALQRAATGAPLRSAPLGAAWRRRHDDPEGITLPLFINPDAAPASAASTPEVTVVVIRLCHQKPTRRVLRS